MRNSVLVSLVVAAFVAVICFINTNTAQAGEINTCMRLVRTRDLAAINAASDNEQELLLLREEVRGDINLCLDAAGDKTDLLREIYWRTTDDGNRWRTKISDWRYQNMIACNWEILAFKNMVNNSFFLGGLPHSGRNVCRGQ